MVAVVAFLHLDPAVDPYPILAELLYDCKVRIGHCPVAPVVHYEHRHCNPAQILPYPVEGLAQRDAVVHYYALVAEPVLVAVVSIRAAVDDAETNTAHEEGHRPGDVAQRIRHDAAAQAVVGYRCRDYDDAVHGISSARMFLGQLERHGPSHRDAEHMDLPVAVAKLEVVVVDEAVPLAEVGTFEVLGVRSEGGDQGSVDIEACLPQASCRVGVHRRCGRIAVDHQDAGLVPVLVDDRAAAGREALRLVALEHFLSPVPVEGQGDVPPDEECDGGDDGGYGHLSSLWPGSMAFFRTSRIFSKRLLSGSLASLTMATYFAPM